MPPLQKSPWEHPKHPSMMAKITNRGQRVLNGSLKVDLISSKGKSERYFTSEHNSFISLTESALMVALEHWGAPEGRRPSPSSFLWVAAWVIQSSRAGHVYQEWERRRFLGHPEGELEIALEEWKLEEKPRTHRLFMCKKLTSRGQGPALYPSLPPSSPQTS